MTFAGAFSSLMITAALFLGCSPAVAEPKFAQADAGHVQPPHKPKSTRPDGGLAPKKGRLASGAPSDEAQPPASPPVVATPKFSNDRCTKDEDCAPVAMCHSDRCVGASHAGTMSSDTMCSMECRGGTVDCGFSHCACVASTSGKKLCALVPGPSEKR